MRIFPISAGAAMLAFTSPAAAQLRPLVEPPASAEAAKAGVDVYLVNDGTEPATQAPAPIEPNTGRIQISAFRWLTQ